MSAQLVAASVGLFLLSALLEIGGGYLMWQWLREDAALWVGGIGSLTCLVGVTGLIYWPRA